MPQEPAKGTARPRAHGVRPRRTSYLNLGLHGNASPTRRYEDGVYPADAPAWSWPEDADVRVTLSDELPDFEAREGGES